MKYELFLLFISFFFILYSCSTKKDYNNRIIDEKLLKVVSDYQTEFVPERNCVIIIELYQKNPKRVYEIKKIDYPHMLDEAKQYFHLTVNSSPVFVSSPFSYSINLPADTLKIRKIIEKTYSRYLYENSYEIFVDRNDYGWFYIMGEEPILFNMIDSVQTYENIEDQYIKLNKIIHFN